MDELKVKILDVKERVLLDNDSDADVLREELRRRHTFFINVMSSPGSGKTASILATARALNKQFKIGVMEADIDSDVDARTLLAAGFPAVQLHTGGMCHLSADMSRQGLRKLGDDDLDVVVLENVGNLVCPAEFDTGAHLNIVILSVPEGDDKPLKYPLMFSKADAVLINKLDSMEVFDFDLSLASERIHDCRLGIPMFAISAETGEGMEAWCSWLGNVISQYLEGSHE